MSSFDRYNATVMDHFLNPRNTGELKDATNVATVQNPKCGDMMKLSLRVVGGRIVAARAKTFGCAAAIASASVLTEMLTGIAVADAGVIRNGQIVEKLGGLPDEKVECSVVAEQAVHAALGSPAP